MQIFAYIALTLLAGTMIGACLGSGLASKPSVLWAIPFTAIFMAGIVLGAWPFASR